MTVAKIPVQHTSALLSGLVDGAAHDDFTLLWLIESMPNRSLGLVILLLSVMSVIPVIDYAARLIMIIIAIRGIVGHPLPLPKRLLNRRFSFHYLAHSQKRLASPLRYLEKLVRPRWSPCLRSKRLSAIILLLLNLLSLIVPLPMTNIPPAIVIFLIALAYIEHDGLLLVMAQTLGSLIIVIMSLALASIMRLV